MSTERVCKGSWNLGTACGTCPRCVATKPTINEAPPFDAVRAYREIEDAARDREMTSPRIVYSHGGLTLQARGPTQFVRFVLTIESGLVVAAHPMPREAATALLDALDLELGGVRYDRSLSQRAADLERELDRVRGELAEARETIDDLRHAAIERGEVD